MEGPGPSAADTELFSEVLRAQTKTFFIDAKENSRGRYVKIAEKGRYRPKSSIVVPANGVAQFLQVLKHFLSEATACRLALPRDIIVESKVFSFSAGSNERGQFVRIFESGGGFPSGGSSLMIPCGWSNSYLKMFCDSLEKIARCLSQDGSLGPDYERLLAGLENNVDLMAAPDNVMLDTKEGGPVLSVGSKHFFFELRSNERGHYLKVKEVSGSLKQLLVIPSHAIEKFQEAIAMTLTERPLREEGPQAVN